MSDAIAAIPVGREINAGDCVRWLAQERGAAAHAEGILRDLIKENFETGRAEIGIAYFSVGSAGKTERFFLIAPGMRPLSPPGELPSSSPLMLSKTLRGVRSDALKSFLQREWEKWARKAVSSGCSPSIWGCLPVHLWKFHDATSTFEMIPLLAQGGNSVRATTGQVSRCFERRPAHTRRSRAMAKPDLALYAPQNLCMSSHDMRPLTASMT